MCLNCQEVVGTGLFGDFARLENPLPGVWVCSSWCEKALPQKKKAGCGMQQHLHCSSLLEELGEGSLGDQLGGLWEAACAQPKPLALGLGSEQPLCHCWVPSAHMGTWLSQLLFQRGWEEWAVHGTGTSAPGVSSPHKRLWLWGPWERFWCSACVRYQCTALYLTWVLGFWTLSLSKAQASLGGHWISTFPEC